MLLDCLETERFQDDLLMAMTLLDETCPPSKGWVGWGSLYGESLERREARWQRAAREAKECNASPACQLMSKSKQAWHFPVLFVTTFLTFCSSSRQQAWEWPRWRNQTCLANGRS